MRRAFLVIGAESSGTRVLTQAFIKAGCYGDGGHQQRLDSLNFNNLPDNIVFRRSLPHAGQWTHPKNLKTLMLDAGYDVEIIGIKRDRDCTILSQLTDYQHAHTTEEAEGNIKRAEKIVVENADVVIRYENFVNDKSFRRHFFESRGLSEPAMYFYDANEKYKSILEEE